MFSSGCILCFFWSNAKESRAGVYAWGIKSGWSHPNAVRLAKGEMEGGAGQKWAVLWACFIMVGVGAISGGSSGRENVFGCGAVLE